jgi:hypothetical protein
MQREMTRVLSGILVGKFDNGDLIPVEVDWKTSNFYAHGHHKSKEYQKFKSWLRCSNCTAGR